ncbi:unnamed protein product [Hymenolepis diminuta]|uniref:Uncharacterized protein n=1 Tax=Hymenolepis diminuta TaxID=6216 RepID=A0A0R3SV93_HYMDI|nr:unnamed protein product [Hymenolepis diminuta]
MILRPSDNHPTNTRSSRFQDAEFVEVVIIIGTVPCKDDADRNATKMATKKTSVENILLAVYRGRTRTI